ncbi:MAG TPA: acyl-CoA dehydrogenase family protein, partial [Polyangiaceae bacterium]
MALSTYESPWATDEVRAFRNSVRQFVESELAPVQEKWREQGRPDPEAYVRAGEVGLLLTDVSAEFGG